MLVRIEKKGDSGAIRAVNLAAFDSPSEADLVDTLRRAACPTVSLVAEEDGNIVGHILFSPVTVSAHPDLQLMGLGPMAVTPMLQRQGIGSALVRAGLEQCKKENVCAVVVLGHPNFYPRFGFSPASAFGLYSEYDVPDEVFMAVELQADALRGVSGTIRYHSAFGAS